MRCPDCQATNPDGAPFCGQCYRRFEAPPADTPARGPWAPATPAPTVPATTGPATPGPATPAPSTSWPSAAPQPAPAVVGPARDAAVGRFAASDGELSWRCAVCDSTQPLTMFTCTVCGARMDAEGGHEGDVDWDDARRAELVMPGLGHLRAGRGGMGISRMAMTGLWFLGFVALALGGGALAGLPLVLGIATIWATGPGDLAAARAGRRARLDPQRFMYLVIAVTVGVIVVGGLSIALGGGAGTTS